MRITQILIEGPDCSGKSTLISRLKNVLHWDAKSLHHRDGDQFSRYLQEYATQERIIFDRGHVSEAVYSMLWRGGTPFSESEARILNTVVSTRMIIILALPSVDVLRARYLERTYQQLITIDELKTTAQLFEQYFTHRITPTFVYCSKDFEESETLVKKIQARIES